VRGDRGLGSQGLSGSTGDCDKQVKSFNLPSCLGSEGLSKLLGRQGGYTMEYRFLGRTGVKITYPDKAPFIEASKAVYEKWADRVGGRKKIEAIKNFDY